MNKEILKKVFAEVKKAAGLDFSITNPDRLGDCQSCVWCSIVEKYGMESRGIWVKHWNRGMNSGAGIDELSEVYIAHDLTDEQAEVVISILSRHYTVTSGVFDHSQCITIAEGSN